MIQYAVKVPLHTQNGTFFANIYPSTGQVLMCVENTTPIYKVDVTKTDVPDEKSYWAWEDPDGDISMIYQEFFITDMCFPDGSKAEEAAGRGKVIRVNIEEIK